MNNFLSIPNNKILYQDDYFFVIKDNYPVSPGHLLIISKELKKDFFELSELEKNYLPKTINWCKNYLDENFKPDGFNIGMNCGESSGQTIFHFHCHIIPRFKGDLKNPKGGVRGVIPDKRIY